MQSVFPGSATELFELLFRAGLEPAMLGRPDGTVLAANAEAQALLGIAKWRSAASAAAG